MIERPKSVGQAWRIILQQQKEIERVETFNRANWAALQEAQRQIERLQAEIAELRSYLDEEREKNEKQVRMTMDAHAKIERLETALAKSCEEGRAEMYDCGFNGLKAKIERLESINAIQKIEIKQLRMRHE